MSGVIPSASSAAPEAYTRNPQGMGAYGFLADAPPPRTLAEVRALRDVRTRMIELDAAERTVRS